MSRLFCGLGFDERFGHFQAFHSGHPAHALGNDSENVERLIHRTPPRPVTGAYSMNKRTTPVSSTSRSSQKWLFEKTTILGMKRRRFRWSGAAYEDGKQPTISVRSCVAV